MKIHLNYIYTSRIMRFEKIEMEIRTKQARVQGTGNLNFVYLKKCILHLCEHTTCFQTSFNLVEQICMVLMITNAVLNSLNGLTLLNELSCSYKCMDRSLKKPNYQFWLIKAGFRSKQVNKHCCHISNTVGSTHCVKGVRANPKTAQI